ncbi:MAG: dienelactone hydrolase family protein [Candidatus Thalassarchaeaceae archaeon]|jgi:dienelactone hydrolase|nr:dienelactone hydrolase family protein [Candidatus Thalassarchaeaceae archaeon]
MGCKEKLSLEDVGEIPFLSASPFEIPHILKSGENTEHPVFGELFFPLNKTGNFPCIVACHGSLGWREHHLDHINNWLEAGFAVFKLHTFESRKIAEIVDNQMMVTHAMMINDAFCALKLLKTHPLIQEDNIAIAGWSLGGTVALYSAWLPIAEALAPNGERFCAHMPIYPAAHMRPEINRWSTAPISILHGSDDDYTPVHFVEKISEMIRSQRGNISLHIYPGAHHAFDSEEDVKWLPNAIRLDHRHVEIDMNGDLWAEKTPGEIISLNEPHHRLAAFQFAQNIGAHAGGNPDAREHSLQYTVDFFNQSI